jgi:hypothetical protein
MNDVKSGWTLAEMRSLYEGGMSIHAVAVHTRLPYDDAYGFLRDAGTVFRQRGWNRASDREKAREYGRLAIAATQGDMRPEQHNAHIAAVLKANPQGFLGPWSLKPGGILHGRKDFAPAPPAYTRAA